VLTDWTHWLSCHHPEQIAALLWALLLLDGPRYALSKLSMCVWDCGRAAWRWLWCAPDEPRFTYCPSVCVVLPVYNGVREIEAALRSVWGTYPKLEIIVIDDGSTDGTYDEAQRFARSHEGMRVLRMPERSGKSPALNLGLRYNQAEVVVCMDADSGLGPAAIWEIVQPLADARVGVVSATVLARNPFDNLLTWFQAYEFLHSVFVGRIWSARLGILGIASGAFAAFRHEALDEGFGWDEGSSADLDLTLRIRKSGWKVAFAPYAECYTDMLPTWRALVRQRLRWDRSIAVRNHGRKHVDMANPFSRNFRLSDFFVLADSWLFSVICAYGILAWAVWFCFFPPANWWLVLLTFYFCYLVFEFVQILVALYYSNTPARDALICAVFPLVLIYQTVLLVVRLVATTEELFLRKSYAESFTPERVRNATWHW
jgi:cellulose synthase/poly-beta-1,6-N-acetylglucosamine synthase-like glycosyltransferase